MKNCFKCNLLLNDDDIICPKCAALQPEPKPLDLNLQQNVPQQTDNAPKIDLSKQNSPNTPPQQNRYATSPQNPYRPMNANNPQNPYNAPNLNSPQNPYNPQNPYSPQSVKNPQIQYYPYSPYNTQGYIPPYQAYYNQNIKSPNTIGFLVWSILLCFGCQFLGIPAVIFSAIAIGNQDPADKLKSIKMAKIFCIIGTALTALIIILYILFLIFAFSGVTSFSSMSPSIG
jgi:hypothetical protein